MVGIHGEVLVYGGYSTSQGGNFFVPVWLEFARMIAIVFDPRRPPSHGRVDRGLLCSQNLVMPTGVGVLIFV